MNTMTTPPNSDTPLSLHCPDLSGRCMKCGEQVVSTSLLGCKHPPYKSPRESELERELAELAELRASNRGLSREVAALDLECGKLREENSALRAQLQESQMQEIATTGQLQDALAANKNDAAQQNSTEGKR